MYIQLDPEVFSGFFNNDLALKLIDLQCFHHLGSSITFMYVHVDHVHDTCMCQVHQSL